ncbi:hypothetical protein BDW66DRAFT_129208 [Aspergillus desertorum]
MVCLRPKCRPHCPAITARGCGSYSFPHTRRSSPDHQLFLRLAPYLSIISPAHYFTMATILTTSIPCYDGEDKDAPASARALPGQSHVSFLSPKAGLLMRKYPLLAIGTLDHEAKLWCYLWVGEEACRFRNLPPASTSGLL